MSPRQTRINLILSSLLVITTLAVVVALPVMQGRHDETGLMLSWLTAPVAAVLFATTRTRPNLVVTSAIAALAIALTMAVITCLLWQAYAEAWMFQHLYAVLAIAAGSVVFEIFAATMAALAVPAPRPPTGGLS